MSAPSTTSICDAAPASSSAPKFGNWTTIAEELAGPEVNQLNIAWACVGRHLHRTEKQSDLDKTALRLLGVDGRLQSCSYTELDQQSLRLAVALQALGLQKGDTVFLLLPRRLELFVACLALWKCGAIVAPLYTAFGPEPIATRVTLGQGRILISTASLYQRKLQNLKTQCACLHDIILLPDEEDFDWQDQINYANLLQADPTQFNTVTTTANDSALLHFTSGTTGTPKGALHVHGAVVHHALSARIALDLQENDIYWCTADPGWVTGMSYGVIAPLLQHATAIVNENEFDAQQWYAILSEQRVSVWYTAPTALRMLIKAGDALARTHSFPCLRYIASVGEALNASTVLWAQDVLGLPVHDNWWQTETGGIMLANTRALPIKPGSLGKPLPGIQAALVHRQDDGTLHFLAQNDEVGELALHCPWPSMFRSYLGNTERYRHCFIDDWYLSGDLMRCDKDGYYWFVGRSDDQIKSAGHLVGPCEIEAVLLEHAALAEAAVIGKPDPLIGETIKAFVSLKAGITDDESLRKSVMAHARKRLGPALAPKELTVLASLPRTRSGKLMRRLLKARELGLPEGDLSTLEQAG